MLDGQGFEGLIGRSVNGYRLTRLIARGGMGIVFEGLQESLDRPVAVKFLYPHLSNDERFRDRFEREARSAARLNHPNIVRILDFGTHDGLYYMIQDLVVGESLRERLTEIHASGAMMRTDAVVAIVEQVGQALSYAHEHGFVHRDVKPGNILLDEQGHALLTDFGVVKIAGANTLTAAGMIIGTPEYMAPEQSAGLTDIGPAADQYALAVVAYEMLVGRVPFQAPTPAAVMRMQLTDPPPPPRTVVPWFPEPVEQVLVRALSKEPFDRFPSVADFVDALQRAVSVARQAAGDTLSQPPIQPPSVASAAALATGQVTPSPSVAAGTMTPDGIAGGQPPIGGDAQIAPVDDPTPRAGRGRPSTLLAAGIIGIVVIGLSLGGFFAFRNHGSGAAQATTASSSGGTSTSTSIIAVAASPTETSAATEAVTAVTATGASTSEPTSAPTPTSASVAVTPPAGEVMAVLFSSHRGGIHDSEIYIMNIDGSDQRQITSSRGHSWGPRISPDGTGFFFSSVAPGQHVIHDASGGASVGSGNHDVYVADLQGNSVDTMQVVNVNNITAGNTSWDNGWTWSPDGKWIAFTSDRAGNWEIYKMSTDGRTIVRLTENPAQDGWPWWTPDGQHIIFSSDRSGESELYVMDPDGTNIQQLTNIAGHVNLYPAVSPDGKKVVFSSQVPSVNEGDVYIMNIDGTDLKRLTNTVALNNIPSFCPDNQHIVYETDQDGNANIYVMNIDGSDVTRLTNDPGEDTTPSCGYIKMTSP